MALPVTVTTEADIGLQNSFHGPFKSSGGNFYTILWGNGTGGPGTGMFGAYKATDPTVSFTEQDTTNRPVVSGVNTSINVYPNGDDLHVVIQSSASDAYYLRLDMSGDTWDAIDGASDRDILIDGAPNGNADACDLVVRSDGDIPVVYQKEIDKVMGNPYERVGLSVSTSANRGETWSAVVRVDSQGDVERDMTGPRIVLGDSDTSHIVWRDQGAGDDTISQRALSSADALQTERTDVTGTENVAAAQFYAIGHGVSFDRGGTTKIRLPFLSTTNRLDVLEFDAAADPSTFTVEVEIDGTEAVNIVNGSIVGCLAVDGSTVHEMHARNSDDDLYTANDQDSDTWTTPALATRGTGTKNHVSCRVYDRSGIKLARIEDDGGTVKYDEDDIGVGDTTISVPQDSFTETDNDPDINTGVTVLAPQESLTETDNDPAVGTGVIVPVPQDSLSETDNAPTVPQIAGVPQDSLSQTDNAPDIRTGVTVGVPADALTQTDNTPTITTGGSGFDSGFSSGFGVVIPTGATVFVLQDNLSQTDNVPGINTGVTVAVPQDSLTQTDNVPGINTGVTVAAPADALTETDNAPNVGTGVIVAASQDALTQVDNALLLSTGVNVETPQDSLTETDNIPEVSTGVSVEPPTDTLSEVDNVPGVGTGVIVASPQDSLTETDNDPALNTGVNVVTPQESLSQTDNIPALNTGVNVETPQDSLSQADQIPSVSTGVNVETPQDSLIETDNAPAINPATTINVPVDVLSIVDHAPDLRTGVNVATPQDIFTLVDNAPVIITTVDGVIKQNIRGFMRNVGRLMNP